MSKPKRDNSLLVSGGVIALMGLVSLGVVFGWAAALIGSIACFGVLMVLIALEVTA